MRLTLRLFALFVLLSLAGFTNLVSPVSKASACTDGCNNGYWACRQNCNGGCAEACYATLTSCLNSCKPEFE